MSTLGPPSAAAPSVPAPPLAAGFPTAEPSLVICYDRKLQVVRANRVAVLAAGRGTADTALCPVAGPARRCGDTCPVRQTLATGLPHEAFFSFADGRARRVRTEPLFDPSGTPAGVIELIDEQAGPPPRDAMLRGNPRDLQTVIDSINDAIFVHDAADGAVLHVSQAACRMYGYAPEELTHCNIGSLSSGAPPYTQEEARRWLERTRSEGPQVFEWRARHRSGELFWVEVSIQFGRLDGGERFFVTVRDIRERKQAEEEQNRAAEVLRQSEERFRLMLGRVPTVAVQGYGPDGTVRYWNAASESLYGYAAAEAIGRNLVDLIIPPPMRDEVRKAVHHMATSGEPIPAAELQLMRKDGVLVSVFSSHAVVNVPGLGPELYCLDIDLTERKKEEEQRLELERRLLNAQKLESLGVLAGGIAHDFNNLLTGVLGNLELATTELGATASLRPLLDDAILSARRAADLTHQMLAYTGRQRFHPEQVDLNRVIRDQIHLLHAALPGETALHLELASMLPAFTADPEQLRQLLVNLVTNAAEAIGRAPGTVEVRTGVEYCDTARLARSHLEEKPTPGRFAFVEVIDTGCGMDAATQQRLFDPFFSTKFAGRGLGMPVVLGIVRAHRGALFVDSSPGRGTTVRALFPAPRESALPPAVAPEATAPEARPAGLLVLVVDDEEPVRKIAQRMGQRLGFEVLTANDADAGIALLRTHAATVACAVLDLTMPTMDGIECLRAMRAIQPNLPAVLASGFAVTTIEARHADAGFTAFLQKPFTMEQFAAVIRQATAAAKP